MGSAMTQQEYDTAVDAFIRAKGVTRCPTAFVVPSQATLAEVDRRALQRRAKRLEALREERTHLRRGIRF